MKKKKLCLAAVLALSLLLLLCACGSTAAPSGEETAQAPEETAEETPAPEETEEEEPPVEEYDPMVDCIEMSCDKGSIRYVGWEKANDGLTELDNALVFSFAFTNQQTKPDQVQHSFHIQFFQNGAELTKSTSYSGKGGDQYDLVSAYFNEAMKGGTVTFGRIVIPEDDSPITVMVSIKGSQDEDSYQMMEVDLQAGSAAPGSAEGLTEEMRQTYADVLQLLSEDCWYFNGGSDQILNRIRFTEEGAEIAQVYYDGNGIHDNGSNVYPYILDGQKLTVTLADGSPLDIAYKVDGGVVTLGEHQYFSPDEVDAGLQGYWHLHQISDVAGTRTECDYNILFDQGKIKMEYASLALGGSNGEYYYYGPFDGSYTLGFGSFETDMRHGNRWFFNIIDGKPTVLYYDSPCEPSDKLPGENGYHF